MQLGPGCIFEGVVQRFELDIFDPRKGWHCALEMLCQQHGAGDPWRQIGNTQRWVWTTNVLFAQVADHPPVVYDVVGDNVLHTRPCQQLDKLQQRGKHAATWH